MYEMLTYILISFCIALTGFTYSVILTDAGMILNEWYIFLQKKLAEKHEKWFNVLIECPKCVSGQISLWLFFLFPSGFDWWNSFKITSWNLIVFTFRYGFSFEYKWLFVHLLFIVITIWFVLIINKLYLWLTN